MLGKDTIPPEQRARALAAIDRNARAQTRLIDDLLDVSRAISGKLQIDARPCNLTDVVHAASETVRPALDAKGITFEMSIGDPGANGPSELEPIVADPDRLQQIVWNLLSNAIKFTPDGGTVRLNVARVDSNVEIVVSDTGIGISPGFLPHVFDRFRQSDTGTRRRFSGLGLGLAIVRHIVELHGGTVSAESAGEGSGSTFRVVLPARPVQIPGSEHVGSAHVSLGEAGAASRRRAHSGCGRRSGRAKAVRVDPGRRRRRGSGRIVGRGRAAGIQG
jgi:signal transduction histidine kinase